MVEENKTLQSNLVTTSALSGMISLNSTILSNSTRIKLKNLGINTKDIKTEEEGQAAIQEAEELIAENKKKAEIEEKQRKAEEDIHYRLRKLAREMGYPLNEYEPVSKMLEKMTRKIKELRNEQQNETAILKFQKHNSEYQDILSRYLKSQQAQQKLDDNLNTMAYYNKLYQEFKLQWQ